MTTVNQKVEAISKMYSSLRNTYTEGKGGTIMTKEEEVIYHAIKIADRYKPTRECFVYSTEQVLEFTEIAFAYLAKAALICEKYKKPILTSSPDKNNYSTNVLSGNHFE